jgi:homoserine dehydrogenase
VGVLHATELKENNWWRENGTSLILSPEPIIEDVEVRKLKKKSLELAGLNFN